MNVLGAYGILLVGMTALGLLVLKSKEDVVSRDSWGAFGTLVDYFFFIGLFVWIVWRGDETVTFHEGMVFLFILGSQILNIRLKALYDRLNER